MAMVSNKFFGAVAVKLGFHKHLRHNTTMLLGQIQEYVAELAQAEESAGGAMDYWMVTKDPPKVGIGQVYCEIDADSQSACPILWKPTLVRCLLTRNLTTDKSSVSSRLTFARTSKT